MGRKGYSLQHTGRDTKGGSHEPGKDLTELRFVHAKLLRKEIWRSLRPRVGGVAPLERLVRKGFSDHRFYFSNPFLEVLNAPLVTSLIVRSRGSILLANIDYAIGFMIDRVDDNCRQYHWHNVVRW